MAEIGVRILCDQFYSDLVEDKSNEELIRGFGAFLLNRGEQELEHLRTLTQNT